MPKLAKKCPKPRGAFNWPILDCEPSDIPVRVPVVQGANPLRYVKTNEAGRRVGEDHPRAVLSDHDVELLWGFLEERAALIARLRRAGAPQARIEAELTQAGLSYRLLAAKFDVHKQTVAKIANGDRRGQAAFRRRKPYP